MIQNLLHIPSKSADKSDSGSVPKGMGTESKESGDRHFKNVLERIQNSGDQKDRSGKKTTQNSAHSENRVDRPEKVASKSKNEVAHQKGGSAAENSRTPGQRKADQITEHGQGTSANGSSHSLIRSAEEGNLEANKTSTGQETEQKVETFNAGSKEGKKGSIGSGSVSQPAMQADTGIPGSGQSAADATEIKNIADSDRTLSAKQTDGQAAAMNIGSGDKDAEKTNLSRNGRLETGIPDTEPSKLDKNRGTNATDSAGKSTQENISNSVTANGNAKVVAGTTELDNAPIESKTVTDITDSAGKSAQENISNGVTTNGRAKVVAGAPDVSLTATTNKETNTGEVNPKETEGNRQSVKGFEGQNVATSETNNQRITLNSAVSEEITAQKSNQNSPAAIASENVSESSNGQTGQFIVQQSSETSSELMNNQLGADIKKAGLQFQPSPESSLSPKQQQIFTGETQLMGSKKEAAGTEISSIESLKPDQLNTGFVSDGNVGKSLKDMMPSDKMNAHHMKNSAAERVMPNMRQETPRENILMNAAKRESDAVLTRGAFINKHINKTGAVSFSLDSKNVLNQKTSGQEKRTRLDVDKISMRADTENRTPVLALDSRSFRFGGQQTMTWSSVNGNSQNVSGKMDDSSIFKKFVPDHTVMKDVDMAEQKNQSFTNLVSVTVSNISIKRNVLPGLTQAVFKASAGASTPETWNKHSFVLEDGSKIQLSSRKVDGVIQLKIGSTTPELNRLLQQHQNEILEHLKKESEIEVDLQFDTPKDDSGFESFAEKEHEMSRKLSGSGTSVRDEASEPADYSEKRSVRSFGYNKMEWTA